MKLRLLTLILVGCSTFAHSQTSPAPAPAVEKTTPAIVLDEKEQKLVASLENVLFDGRWTPIENGTLGAEKSDTYAISKAVKLGKNWTINAKMEYGGKSFEIPVPVKIEWAGDTAVIIVDNLALMGPQKYSARVLVYNGTYAGTWTGQGQGGLLSGIIRKQPPAAANAAQK